MKKLKLRIIGLLLAPILYLRWSIVLIAIILTVIAYNENIPLTNAIMLTLGVWLMWSIIGGFIYGNCEALRPIVEWLVVVLNVQYKEVTEKSYTYTGAYSKTRYETYLIHGAEYEFSGTEVGCSNYEAEASISRSILFTYLFN